MFAFTILCVFCLVSLVHATPLDLRDVFSPHITSPNEKSVWPVGSTQFVTWETDNIPPDSQLTNPNGKVVLGHMGPTGGLNLDLDHPLAQNFKLRLGKIQVTVPNVTPRDDYLIVLFGDSGNASPAFAITRITNGGTSSSNATQTMTTSTKAASPNQSTTITTPIPITGSTITGGSSPSPSSTGVTDTSVQLPSSSSLTSAVPTVTSPVSLPAASSSSASTAPSPSPSSNAASPRHSFHGMGYLSSLGLAFLIVVLVI